MLADRDALPSHRPQDELEQESVGRLKTLCKYHLENYFLDSETLASCFVQMENEDSWLRNPMQIEQKLKEIACQHIGYAASLITAKYVRDHVGNIDVMLKGSHEYNQAQFVDKLLEKTKLESRRISSLINEEEIGEYAKSVYQELETILHQPGDAWKVSIPGKLIFAKFCSKANIPQGRMKTLYIRYAQESTSNPFLDIYGIFEEFSKLDQ